MWIRRCHILIAILLQTPACCIDSDSRQCTVNSLYHNFSAAPTSDRMFSPVLNWFGYCCLFGCQLCYVRQLLSASRQYLPPISRDHL
ncbi:uncharacterized protein YALI1_F03197g [Yarrowia lipolytica]|uniref:Secreted protein n=1 Tax=Yarrowia lipolytica TaxID=4952 RepID=A0A1D8NLK9_YARLL|nr:hypothetical protein YALI1_F03197g [Yarrowia lipolytica]